MLQARHGEKEELSIQTDYKMFRIQIDNGVDIYERDNNAKGMCNRNSRYNFSSDCRRHDIGLDWRNDMPKDRKKIEPPEDFGVFGIWAWRVNNVKLFIVQEGHGHLWPPKTAKYLDVRAGKFETLEQALENEPIRKFVISMLEQEATHLTIGTGGKWQIYCLLDTDTARDIYKIISSHFKELDDVIDF